jgi:hypothetical protein
MVKILLHFWATHTMTNEGGMGFFLRGWAMVLATEVDKELGLYPNFLIYHGRVGHIPKPAKFGHARVFTEDQVEEIRAFVTLWNRHKAELHDLKTQEE